MNLLPITMQVVSAVLDVYMLLLLIRVLLTWVSMDHRHKVIQILRAVTDPYLEFFRRFRFLVIGRLDFSPLAALLVVNFFSSLARMVGMYGQISLGIVLSILVQLLWGAASFFFMMLGILAVIRYLGIIFRWGGPGLWEYIDAILQPAALALNRWIRPKGIPAYTTSLLILGIANLAVWGLGSLLFWFLGVVLLKLPV